MHFTLASENSHDILPESAERDFSGDDTQRETLVQQAGLSDCLRKYQQCRVQERRN